MPETTVFFRHLASLLSQKSKMSLAQSSCVGSTASSLSHFCVLLFCAFAAVDQQEVYNYSYNLYNLLSPIAKSRLVPRVGDRGWKNGNTRRIAKEKGEVRGR